MMGHGPGLARPIGRRDLLRLTGIATIMVATGCAAPRAPSAPSFSTAIANRPPSTLALSPTPVVTPTPTPGDYLVQPGDTLGLIAQRLHTTVAALKQANALAGDTIRVGQTLTVPTPTPVVPTAAARTPPADQSPATAVYRGRTDTNALALTFDAGADVGYTRLILDTLKHNDVRATFGMTGQWAQDNADLIREMAAGGHVFINHTWDHQSFTGLSTRTQPLTQAERWSELDRTEDALHALTGATTLPYFRAPFGDDDRSVEADAGLRGYRYDILWTVDTGGWNRASVGQIIATSSKGAVPGAIIVMHVGAESQDGPALQSVIDAIRQKGLQFATIPELVAGS